MISSATAQPTALQALIDEGGIDPAPYFEMAADSLLVRHGREALGLSDRAIEDVKAAGDDEGLVLWREVRAVLARRLRSFEDADPIFH